MRAAGFDVTVKGVPWDRPGDRDVIVGIYGPGGKVTGVPADTTRFRVEIGSPGGGHGGFRC